MTRHWHSGDCGCATPKQLASWAATGWAKAAATARWEHGLTAVTRERLRAAGRKGGASTARRKREQGMSPAERAAAEASKPRLAAVRAEGREAWRKRRQERGLTPAELAHVRKAQAIGARQRSERQPTPNEQWGLCRMRLRQSAVLRGGHEDATCAWCGHARYWASNASIRSCSRCGGPVNRLPHLDGPDYLTSGCAVPYLQAAEAYRSAIGTAVMMEGAEP